MKRFGLSPLRITIGAILWIACAVVIYRYWVTPVQSDESASASAGVTEQLWKFTIGRRQQYELQFDEERVAQIGDPVCHWNADGQLEQIGVVTQVGTPENQDYAAQWVTWAQVTFFAGAPPVSTSPCLRYHETPSSMDWVVKYMLPAEKRREILQLLLDVFKENQQEILENLLPVVRRVFQEASVVIQAELVRSVENRRAEWQTLGTRYRVEIVERELIPLLSDRIWPLVLKESQPLLEDVGKEIWGRASVWRFGWRALYDAAPLTNQNLTKQEFDRFVANDAAPVLRDHIPKFLQVQHRILRQLAQDQYVQAVLKENAWKVIDDPDFQKLVWLTISDVLVNNERLNDKLLELWSSYETKQLLTVADDRLEPTISQIGEILFGTPTKGVTPEFARVLRNKVLMKDSRWFVLDEITPADSPSVDDPSPASSTNIIPVIQGYSIMDQPFILPARNE